MTKFSILFTSLLIAAAGNAQLVNADFEQWEAPITEEIMYNKPTGWLWTDGFSTSEEQFFYNPPQQDAQMNDFALTLSIWYHYGKDIALQTAPIDYRPEQLKGFFKYTHTMIEDTEGPVADTALIEADLTKFNPTAQLFYSVGKGTLSLTSIEEYQAFEVNISYTSDEVPEYVTVRLDPSLVRRYIDRFYISQAEPVASFFTVDNLSLHGDAALSVNNTTKENNMALYPNPAKDNLRVALDEKQAISIYTTTGTLVESLVAKSMHTLDVSNYAQGIYIIKSQDEVARFIKE